jgi:hypothetical protein
MPLQKQQRGPVSVAPLGLRIIQAMQPSASPCETAKRVLDRARTSRAGRHVRSARAACRPFTRTDRVIAEFIDLDSGVGLRGPPGSGMKSLATDRPALN